jgi:hypothetical protein
MSIAAPALPAGKFLAMSSFLAHAERSDSANELSAQAAGESEGAEQERLRRARKPRYRHKREVWKNPLVTGLQFP